MQLVRDFGNDNPLLPQQGKTQPEGGLGMQQVLPTVPEDKLRDDDRQALIGLDNTQ
jgi:hypothetical protein